MSESTTASQAYLCVVCGFIYEAATGWPQEGIAPGTRWEEIPDHWVCPDCGAGKTEFKVINSP